MSTRWVSALGGVWSQNQTKRSTEKAPVSHRLPVAFSVFIVLAQVVLGAVIPQGSAALPAPTSTSGLFRINELTLEYNGTYYYYQEPTKPIDQPDDSADMLLNNGKPDISKASGPVFSRVDDSSTKKYCYDIIYYDARGGGWQRDFSTNDAGACTSNQVATLPEPQDNSSRGLVTFFNNTSANTIESVRLSNATPFIQVTQSFPGSDQVSAVFKEQKAASDCPDLMIYFKSGAIGILHPQKGTPSGSDSSSAYREILRATGEDSGQCIAPDHDATVSWLNNTFLVPTVVTDTHDSWVSFLNMKGSVQLITPSVASDSSAGGLALTRADSTQKINDSGSGNSNSVDQKDDCPVDANSKLRWIICPLILLGDTTVQGLDSLLNKFLYTPTDQVFSSNFNQTADVFRNLGLGLVVIAGLVMVVTQAIGMEIFSAYTVRKVLPRLVIAAIGIALARPLLEFIVTFFNDLGLLVDKLILATVQVKGSTDGVGTGILAALEGFTITTTATVAAIALLGPMGILSLIFTVLAALFVGLLVLAGRQLIILVAILVAPLAIAAYILPGTEKIWKFWKGALTSMLVAFPIITGFIATGKALSDIALASDSGELKFLGVLVRYLPYFMLPFAFKLAGGMMGTIFSMVNDKSKGVFDRNKKFRQGRMAENKAAMRAGTRFNHNGLNSLTSRATTRGFGLTSRGREAYQQKMDLAAAAHAKSEAGQAVAHNDAVLRAQTYASAEEAKANMAKDFGLYKYDAKGNVINQAEADQQVATAIAGAKANGGFGRARQIYAAQQLSATGTGYDSMEQVAATIARVSYGNDSQIAGLAGTINASTKQAGRPDLAPGAGKLNELSRGMAGLEGGSQDFDGGRIKASRGMDAVSILRGKTKDVQNLTAALQKHLEANVATLNDPSASREQKEAALLETKITIGQIQQLDANKQFASVENQQVVNETVLSAAGTRAEALRFINTLPNAAEHIDDIKRFSATPEYGRMPGDPTHPDSATP